MNVKFFKYQGTGNDFIIIDLRKFNININKETVSKICDRKYGIGSDGLMLINNKKNYDFEMVFYNPDGSKSFCGNGSRCAVLYNFHQGLIQKKCSFYTNDGPHQGHIYEGEIVKISILGPVTVKKLLNGDYQANTGSPHYIQFRSSWESLDFITHCRSIRNNIQYKVNGINVNLVKSQNQELFMRTYERGVENETLSCGSGVTAAALAYAIQNDIPNKVLVNTLGGQLFVEFEKKDTTFTEIFLSGPSSFVFSGEINI